MKLSSTLGSLILPAGAALAAPASNNQGPSPVVKRAPMPTPPGIPSSSSALTSLAALTVGTNEDDGEYDRDLFPTWITIEGNCNTREYVLNRDGTDLTIADDCYPDAGTWVSPYDGGEWTAASDVDIDHMVPLKNAWISGANAWTTDKREQFANDIERPQLWAVTDSVNQEKSDGSPDEWQPPLASFYCTYASAWVAVKAYWELSVTEAEKAALADMLDTC
ncbi:hypothetical protein F4778DRAFT_55214 [Xylariomycetidae sp. FL2044]|nr:hypothetical protein F4778DRAFT_55214 [Xylariomycetidae sp. FL2044]